jgi:anti-anti-sigma factor
VNKLLVITCKDEPGALVISVKGEVDLTTAPEFLADLLRHSDEHVHRNRVIVDLSHTVHFAVRGLDVLERGQQHLRRQARYMVVVASPGSVARRMLDMLNFREQMPVLDTVRQAIHHAKRPEGLAGNGR